MDIYEKIIGDTEKVMSDALEKYAKDRNDKAQLSLYVNARLKRAKRLLGFAAFLIAGLAAAIVLNIHLWGISLSARDAFYAPLLATLTGVYIAVFISSTLLDKKTNSLTTPRIRSLETALYGTSFLGVVLPALWALAFGGNSATFIICIVNSLFFFQLAIGIHSRIVRS